MQIVDIWLASYRSWERAPPSCAIRCRGWERYGSLKASEGSVWLWHLPSVVNNPSVTGFLIEHACLSCIALNGLRIGLDLKGGMVTKTFTGSRPGYTWEDKRVVYCPTSFNFPAIDALIVLKDGEKDKKKALLFPIQVTIAKQHENSEPAFFADWAEWCRDLGDVEIEIHFLWVTNDDCHRSKKVVEDSLLNPGVGGLPILVTRATGFLSVRLARTSRNVCKLLEQRPKQKHQRLNGRGVILWRLIAVAARPGSQLGEGGPGYQERQSLLRTLRVRLVTLRRPAGAQRAIPPVKPAAKGKVPAEGEED